MSKKYNNADSTLAWDLQASWLSFVVKTWEWALFPTTSDAPYKMTHEHYEWSVVTKREILTISARSGDAFTVSARASESCVQDDSADPKTRTANALSFSSWDRVYLTINEDDWNALETFKDTTVPNTYATKAEMQKQADVYWASSTGNDDYAITLDPVPSALSDLKWAIRFLADVGNTWASTLNINSLWAKTIKKANDQDLDTWDIEANQIIVVVYNASSDTFSMTSQVAMLPSVDINGLSAETTLATWDEFIFYDASVWVNKKIDESNLKSSIWALSKVDNVLISRNDSTASWSIVYWHNLWIEPKAILFSMVFWFNSTQAMPSSEWSWDWTHNKCIYTRYNASPTLSWSQCIYQNYWSNSQYANVSAVSSTDFTLSWTKAWWSTNNNLRIIATLFA